MQGRKRCLITRAIYLQAEGSNLCITDTDVWRADYCRLKFRRDQIAKGLTTLDGVDEKAGRRLARRIPAREYPARIEAVKKYCCKNFCTTCRGARLHGDIQVKGFKARRKGEMQMMTLEQYIKPKKDECEWRLAKRRRRNEAGVLQPRGWLSSCVECSSKYQETFDLHNAEAKAKRHRIKEDELQYLRSGNKVQVNKHDLTAWTMFAEMKKKLVQRHIRGMCVCLFPLPCLAFHLIHTTRTRRNLGGAQTSRSACWRWYAINHKTARDMASAITVLSTSYGGNHVVVKYKRQIPKTCVARVSLR